MTVAANEKGEIIALSEINYVRYEEDMWVPSEPENAEAIAVHNVLYSLGEPIYLPPLEDGEPRPAPTATLFDVPEGALTVDLIRAQGVHTVEIGETQAALADVYETQLGQADQTLETQTALAEVYESTENLATQVLEIQLAMAEQYENGGTN